jgi:glycosyltransferase involved in cell wall biosynthesis
MNILMLAQFYPPIIGGEERHVRNLARALAGRSHSVSVATLAIQGQPSVEMDGPVKVYRVNGTAQRLSSLYSEGERQHVPPLPDPELLVGLKRVIDEERPQIIHAHNWLLHSFLPLKQWSGAKLVVTLHDYSLICPKKSMMYRDGLPCSGAEFAKCFSCATDHYGAAKGTVTVLAHRAMGAIERQIVDRFLTVSAAVGALNRLADQSVPWEVMPNFVPDDLNQLATGHDDLLSQLPDEDFVLFVGDLTRNKGVHLLLDAYRRLERPAPLVMIGRELPDTPKDLPDGVRVLHSWPHAAIMQAWSRCLFGVAPSVWHEPCATVVMEAMSLGKPMIVSDLGGMPDLVDNGWTGFVVSTEDSYKLASAMQTILDDRSMVERFGRAALRKVRDFQAGTVVPRIEQIYSDLLVTTAVGSS